MRPLPHLLFLVGLSLAAIAAPSASDLADLFLPAELDNPKLSPDGTMLGFIARRGDKFSVGLYDLRNGQIDLSKSAGDVRPLDIWWKSPTRLLIKTSNSKLDALGYTIVDVTNWKSEDAWRLARQTGQLLDPLVNDPTHVLFYRLREITRVDITSGDVSVLDRSPGGNAFWVLDPQRRARATFWSDAKFGTADFYWNAAAGGEWQSRHFEARDRRFIPQGLDPNGRMVWGWAWSPHTPSTFAQFDTHTGQFETKEFIPGVQPTHLLQIASNRQPLAVAFAQGATVQLRALAERHREGVARLQKSFEGFFPVVLDALPDDKTWLVWIGNSRLPGAYFQFNHHTGEAVLIGLSHNQAISEDRLASGEYFTFRQRGGGQLSARLWRPASQPPLPLIVLAPHSLPAFPALDLYDPAIQALVAQGFAVLKVNIRGTIAFGQSPVDLSQDADWASFVQEDLEDAVEELLRHSIVDPKSVNLLGGVFGGVIALEIATKSNRFTAVAALNVPAKIDRYDLMHLANAESVNALSDNVGGWMASARLARDLSPVKQVPELRIPALFLHNEDSIKGRPNEEGRSIRSALGKAKVPTRTGLAFSWSDKPKPPSLLAREHASIYRQVADFFRNPGAK